jgi:hypothetical protein
MTCRVLLLLLPIDFPHDFMGRFFGKLAEVEEEHHVQKPVQKPVPPEHTDSQFAEGGSHDIHRGLKARHITMIAIGSSRYGFDYWNVRWPTHFKKHWSDHF